MAGKSVSIDHINEFVIQNFIPYSWAHLWETTGESQLFKFVMCIRPNVYERRNRQMIEGEWEPELPSSNSMEFMPPEYYSSFCIEIPMVRGYAIGKRGASLDSDSDLKERYIIHLKKSISQAALNLHGIATLKDPVAPFGVHYSNVKSWMNQEPRESWSIFHNSNCSN